jgi:hypothetical protein
MPGGYHLFKVKCTGAGCDEWAVVVQRARGAKCSKCRARAQQQRGLERRAKRQARFGLPGGERDA